MLPIIRSVVTANEAGKVPLKLALVKMLQHIALRNWREAKVGLYMLLKLLRFAAGTVPLTAVLLHQSKLKSVTPSCSNSSVGTVPETRELEKTKFLM